MKVFVAGATGAIGRPLISALLEAGHEVLALSSTEDGARRLREKGIETEVANVLDKNAVLDISKKVRPNAVIDELTSLPKNYTPEEMRAAAERDRTVRLVGGTNLQDAADAAGAKRYIVQSTGFFYAPGSGLAIETDPFASQATPGVAGSVRTYMEIERRVLNAAPLEGIALRYGFFYGPNTYHDPVTGSVSNQVRAQQYPVIGSGRGVFSFVHVEDAAAATVAALDADPGVYNVVDDDPSEMSAWLPAFARFLGAPAPPTITEAEALRTGGADSIYYATQLRGASNARAKQKLGFAPRKLEWFAASGAARAVNASQL